MGGGPLQSREEHPPPRPRPCQGLYCGCEAYGRSSCFVEFNFPLRLGSQGTRQVHDIGGGSAMEKKE